MRELTEQEINLHKLRYGNGAKIPHIYEDNGVVWLSQEENPPESYMYRFYDCGTNYFKVLVYNPIYDNWTEVELKDIPLYSIIWKMLLELNKLRS